MNNDLVSGEKALEIIALCRAQGRRVLGVDGFALVSKGYVARLDLILDLSDGCKTLQEVAQEAAAFISQHNAGNIVFEVVVAAKGVP